MGAADCDGEGMRRPAGIKRAGPYLVTSVANGKIIIQPEWPAFPKENEEDGGGPDLPSRLNLAWDIETWLNNRIPL